MPSGPLMRNNLSENMPNTTLRYSNKDGTKSLTIQRKQTVADSAAVTTSAAQFPPPPPTPASSNVNTNAGTTAYNHSIAPSNPAMASIGGQSASGVNKKKKKKKSKGQGHHVGSTNHQDHIDSNEITHTNGPISKTTLTSSPGEYQQHRKTSLVEFDASDLVEADPDEIYFSDEEAPYETNYSNDTLQHQRQPDAPPLSSKKKNKKKKKKNPNRDHLYPAGGGSQAGSMSNGGTGPGAAISNNSRKGKDKIWNTSTNEERERIKEFWLSLGEEDRRSLVKVEKEAVLKKMKEQQKHSCSCSVCGRKRTAIEEELEVLYDAYYEELEQYANQQQSKFVDNPSPLPPHFSSRGHPSAPLRPPTNRIEEIEDEDDEYDDYDDDEGEDAEAIDDGPFPVNDPRPDFFTFGNSLTVQGGILTVADDLLKNDGKKFIEMMEQLAERRMQREEEASAAANGHLNLTMPLSSHGSHPSNHPQPQDYDENDEDDDEDDFDYGEEEEEDDEDTMTEEQRMEEGRRMFQIFAARMFEQRVLQAYREKVAQERQRKLLEELEEENRLKAERELRKAREKERKKDRKRQLKQAKEEERLKREAERAAEEAAQKAIEEERVEEARKRKEEQRLKRETERKAAEEGRLRKDEEKRKRQQEEREREAERERKRKEHQERERKKKEETVRKAKEEKEAREKEVRERKEREDRERRAKEAAAKKLAEEQEKARKEEDEKRAAATAAAAAAAVAAAAAAARAQQTAGLLPSNSHVSNASYNSPRLPVAAPAVPKQNLPTSSQGRPKQASQQGSVGSSPKTPQVIPRIMPAAPSTPVMQQQGFPGPIAPQNKVAILSPSQQLPASSNASLPQTPHTIGPPPGVPLDHSFSAMSPLGMNGPGFLPGIPQRQVLNGVPMYPAQGQMSLNATQFRGFGPPNTMPIPVPAPGLRPVGQAGRGIFIPDIASLPQPIGSPLPAPGAPLYPQGSPFSMPPAANTPNSQTHSRQLSGSFEESRPTQRPSQPAPIQRPQSTVPKTDDQSSNAVMDDLNSVLGSRALMADEDDLSFSENVSPTRRGSSVSSVFSGRPRIGFAGFEPIGTPGKDVFGTSPVDPWAPVPLGQPSGWSNTSGPWSDRDILKRGFNRRGETRLDSIRLLACRVCQQMSGSESNFLNRDAVSKAITSAAGPDLLPVQERELDAIFEVEGDSQNGGGTFIMDRDQHGNNLIKFEPTEDSKAFNPAPIAPGEVSSPSTGNAHPYVGASSASPGGIAIPPPGVSPPPHLQTGSRFNPAPYGVF